MNHEMWVVKEFGLRYWCAYILIRLANRIKNTTRYQVIRTPQGSSAIIECDAWGGGVMGATRMSCEYQDIAPPEWPVIHTFDDFDAALDWMRGDGDG